MTLAYVIVTAYLLGVLTLPAAFVGAVAAFFVVDRVAGWWRGPKRWQSVARYTGRRLAQEPPLVGKWVTEWAFACADGDSAARRWARWCPWWPA